MKHILWLLLTLFVIMLMFISCSADESILKSKTASIEAVNTTLAPTIRPLPTEEAHKTPLPQPSTLPQPSLQPIIASTIQQKKLERDYIICIDPGHQQKANNELEADGPGSKVMKPKVSSGTQGVSTKKPEYVLNLEVSFLLRDQLLAEGYHVVMTRDKSEINLSNKERADIANAVHADLFVRIHADGNEQSSIKGISVQYPAKSSPYAHEVFKPSKSAAAYILSAMLKATGAESRGIVARSDLSGFNWAKVPSMLIEMGFMSNKDEDIIMSTSAGITAGIDQWFAER
jgi:N-acetylmuramoyl-L-alanine amidase